MGSKIFSSMDPDDIEEASAFAKKFMDDLVGQKLSLVAAANVMTLEFITRHTHFTIDDIIESIEFLKDFNDERGEVGSMSTANIVKGCN